MGIEIGRKVIERGFSDMLLPTDGAKYPVIK